MRARRERLKQGAGLVYRVAIASFLIAHARAQLAITEVMSSAAEDPSTQERNADFWELTNFGTSRIDLTQYGFNDADHDKPFGLVPIGSPISFVEPFQSIVFVRSGVFTNETQFFTWWGSSVRSNTVISFYEDPGFSSGGDALTLYSGTGEIVDAVRFGAAKGGASFVYDTATGEFGDPSVPGRDGSWSAETTTDVGSPGATAGMVPLKIVSHPKSVEVYPLLTTTLTVKAIGLPRPRYQWFFKEAMLLNETRASLTLSNVTLAMAGSYHVEVSNGLTNLISSNVFLTLNNTPTAPRIISAPGDATVLENRSARFNLVAASLPLASYQWFINDVPLPGETNRSLLIPNCTLEMSGAEVRVRMENSLGLAEAPARLYVTNKLDLRITEIHADPRGGCENHNDWFEVTNFGATDIQLLGYRFFDRRRINDAVVITEAFALTPGESMIFVNNSAVGSFVEWWGIQNLPPGLKIYGFDGFSLSDGGETLYLWGDTAETDLELVAEQASTGFQKGVSQWFDNDIPPIDPHSVLGQRGAFQAVECGDIGSPGYITNPSPRFVSVERSASGTRLKWRAFGGARYEVASSPSLGHPWNPIAIVTSTNSIAEIVDSSSINTNARFYQVREVAP